MIIDLHGYTETEALGEILTALLDFENNEEMDRIEFITGKGQVLRDIVIEEVEQTNFKWYFNGSNTGSIIVKK